MEEEEGSLPRLQQAGSGDVRTETRGCGEGKRCQEASGESPFIFCKESALSAGGNGQAFSTGVTRRFASDTGHSGSSVGAVMERRDCRQEAGPGYQTGSVEEGNRNGIWSRARL